MNFTGPAIGQGLNFLNSTASTAQPSGTPALGTRQSTRDGREFVYVKAGAVALVPGNVIQSPAEIANHQQLTPVAAAAGDTSITVALGATLASANQYAGGWAIVDTTPGLGQALAIDSHPAAALSTSVVLKLTSDSPVQVALTTVSRISLQMNPYNGVIQAPVTTLTGAVIGICVFAIGANEFGWLQVRGPAPVLITGTPGPGLSVGVPAGTAGAVLIDSAALVGYQAVGRMLVTGVAGKVQAVMVNLV